MKNPILELSHSRLGLCLLLVCVVALSGCASSGAGGAPAAPAGPSDEELISDLVMGTITALQAKEIDKMMMVYADDFSSDTGDKAAMKEFLAGAASQGFLDGMEANTDAMAVMVEGDTAKVSGVSISGAFGMLDLGFELAKREGQWLVVSQTQQ